MDDQKAGQSGLLTSEELPANVADCAIAYAEACREWHAAARAESEAESEARARRGVTNAAGNRVRQLRNRLDHLADAPKRPELPR